MSTPDSPVASPVPEISHDPTDPDDSTNEGKDLPVRPAAHPANDMDELSDSDSVLSDIDEAQFEDFDPANLDIADRPTIAVDEDNVNLIGRHKRKRDTDGVDGQSKPKKKESRREKPKKAKRKKRADDDDDAFSGGEEMAGKRPRKKKGIAGDVDKRERRKARSASPDNDDDQDPETRKTLSTWRAMYRTDNC